jgi:hypothetical protein
LPVNARTPSPTSQKASCTLRQGPVNFRFCSRVLKVFLSYSTMSLLQWQVDNLPFPFPLKATLPKQ